MIASGDRRNNPRRGHESSKQNVGPLTATFCCLHLIVGKENRMWRQSSSPCDLDLEAITTHSCPFASFRKGIAKRASLLVFLLLLWPRFNQVSTQPPEGPLHSVDQSGFIYPKVHFLNFKFILNPSRPFHSQRFVVFNVKWHENLVIFLN